MCDVGALFEACCADEWQILLTGIVRSIRAGAAVARVKTISDAIWIGDAGCISLWDDVRWRCRGGASVCDGELAAG